MTILPEWKPKNESIKKFRNHNYKIRYLALKYSSYNYTKKTEIRKAIFERDNYKCTKCKNEDNLTIDHKISIREFAEKKLYYIDLNKESNLITLCITCNIKKS